MYTQVNMMFVVLLWVFTMAECYYSDKKSKTTVLCNTKTYDIDIIL